MKRLILIALIGLVGCGGGGSDGFDLSASESPPNVTGVYTCQSNCSDSDCVYSAVIEVDQDGADLTAYTYAGTLLGAIDNDGDFIAADENQECSGNFDGDSFTVYCESVDGTIACPTATFIAQ